MRTSSNPAFRNLPTGNAAHGHYGAPPVGFNQPQGGGPAYGAPQASPGAADRPMTVDDVVIKTGITLGVTLITGVLTGAWAQSRVAAEGAGAMGSVIGAALGGLIVGLVLAMVMTFRRKPSAPLTLAYGAAEGVFLGAISGLFAMMFNPAIVVQALIGTAAVFVTMLVVYKTGAVKVTPKLTKWVVGVLGGAMLLVLVNLVLSFFTAGGFGLFSGGPLTVIFALVVIGAAAFAFLLDFDEADRIIRAGMPAKWAWYVAFGLIATLVLLYYYMLILLSSLQGD